MARTDIARASNWRRLARLAALICAVGLAACAPLEDAFQAARQTVADRGIGGTGISDNDGGIGGTGIIGTITAFGSVIVNGLEVEFDNTTPLSYDATPGTSDGLSIGQVVAIEAATVASQLVAQSIAVQFAVSGPISSLSSAERTLTVLGQTIALGPNALIDSNSLQASDFAVGRWVTVSGLRRPDGRIVASLVERRAAEGIASLRGTVGTRTSAGFRVGDQTVVVADGAALPEPGRSVFFAGRLTQSGLVADNIEVAPIVPFDGRMSRLSLEGYLGVSRDQLVVNGFVITLDAAAASRLDETPALTAGSRIKIDARFSGDGTLKVEEIVRVEPGPADTGNGASSNPAGETPERESSLMRR